MTNTSLEDQNAKSLGRAMKSAIETLRPHYSQRAIAAKLDLGKKRDDWRTGEKPKAKALRDFLNQKRTSKRLSYVWINFAYEIMELLFKNSDRDAAVLAEARVFSAVLEKYLLKFHSLDAKHFLVPPNLGESNYRFRMPRVESELMFFGQFSDDEPHIAAANPGLEGEKRIRFYKEWFNIRRDAFLILDRINHRTGNWDAVAVSIILPLSAEGDQRIRRGDVKTVVRRPDGWFSSGLSKFIVQKGSPAHALLLDTWIVKRKKRQRRTIDHRPAPDDHTGASVAARESHQRWAMGLVMKHISILTENTGLTPILVEPDHEHIRYLCRIWNFDCKRDGELYIASPDEGRSMVMNLLWNGVTEAAKWEVAR